jgi:LacI family transcriptional regulator
MNDVAREAGVALKTVSRFVNGATNIDPVLAARIDGAIHTLGYRRNLAAASIRPGRSSGVIGMIIGDLANPYYSVLARAVETYAREQDYLLITASSDEDGVRHDRLVDRLLDQRAEGLLVVPPRRTARRWDQVLSPLPPLVFLDRPVAFEQADTVLADNEGGAYEATRTLIRCGAQQVAFVGDDPAIYTMRERFAGYLRAMQEAGLVVEHDLVRTDAHNAEQARAAVGDLLIYTGADAVFAANNRSAVGALSAFADAERRVALIGFDDFEGASLVQPAVSVVSQPIVEMGRRAAEILIGRLAGSTSPRTTHVLPTTLVVRGSEQQTHEADPATGTTASTRIQLDEENND